jgi:hypothetical protein
MSVSEESIYLHSLSYPELIWLDFLTEFFQQPTLMIDGTGKGLPNRFFYNPAENDSNRQFDIRLAFDFSDSRQNALPALVVEETGVAQVGVAVNQLKDWRVAKTTQKDRADLLRTTYIFHCLSKDRGESRLLASILSSAIIYFKDEIYNAGLNKIEPWTIGASMAMRSDSAEDYVDTPVQVTFEYAQFWSTREVSPLFSGKFCLVVSDRAQLFSVRASLDARDPELFASIRASLDAVDPNATFSIRASADVQDPVYDSYAIRSSLDALEPSSTSSAIRASMRIA